jgi:hypothetical protein
MSEKKVVGIHNAHQAREDRGGPGTFAEKYARDVVSGKVASTPRILEMSVKYILDIDKARKEQRAASIKERRGKKKSAKETEVPAKESEITPELAKRLQQSEGV